MKVRASSDSNKLDRETNLHYNYHRWYDPGTGRYPTPDPLGLAGGDLSLYLYAKNNPLSHIDPLGLCDPGDYACQAAVGSTTIPQPTNASCGCSSSSTFGQRWWSAFSQTMTTVPGVLAPTGMGFFGAKSFARGVGGQTWGQWLNAPNWSVYGMPMPPLRPPVVTSALKFGAYGVAFTGGAAVGAAIYAGLTCD